MKIRSSRISDSISSAIAQPPPSDTKAPYKHRLIRRLRAFFAFFRLLLEKYRSTDFQLLRKDVWGLDEEAYIASFPIPATAPLQDEAAYSQPGNRIAASSSETVQGLLNQPDTRRSALSNKGKSKKGVTDASTELVPVGDLGYSGSTFFTTPNSKYLVKSLPRSFEHTFFTQNLLDPYLSHMQSHPSSLLVRITDLVHTRLPALGGVLGVAPTHHVIMENLLYGKALAEENSAEGETEETKWETYDLKPESYFFPERDILDGKLASENVKSKLVDTFPSKLHLSTIDKSLLLETLSKDTSLLAENQAVDYSLFLVRIPVPAAEAVSTAPPYLSEGRDAHNDWRTGVFSSDGKWIYRVLVLDFFWSKNKLRARAMTWLINTFNLIARKGPMSITAEPAEYRDRFLRMVREMIAIEE